VSRDRHGAAREGVLRHSERGHDGIAADARRKVKPALKVVADATSGFLESEIGIVRDNARQLKFKPEATGLD
jgi:hypothetical protein